MHACMQHSSLLADEPMQWSSAGQPLHRDAIRNQTAKCLPLVVVCCFESRETEIIRHVDLHAARELELGTTKCFDCNLGLLILGSHRHQYLTNVDPCSGCRVSSKARSSIRSRCARSPNW